MSRPTFYLDGCEVRAVFVDLIINTPTGPHHLMQEKNGVCEEFGGKTDIVDRHYLDTAIRETLEESNNAFSRYYLLQVLQEAVNQGQYILNPRSKALILRIPMKHYIPPRAFGDYEVHDNLPRRVVYVPEEVYRNPSTPMHPRMTYIR